VPNLEDNVVQASGLLRPLLEVGDVHIAQGLVGEVVGGGRAALQAVREHPGAHAAGQAVARVEGVELPAAAPRLAEEARFVDEAYLHDDSALGGIVQDRPGAAPEDLVPLLEVHVGVALAAHPQRGVGRIDASPREAVVGRAGGDGATGEVEAVGDEQVDELLVVRPSGLRGPVGGGVDAARVHKRGIVVADELHTVSAAPVEVARIGLANADRSRLGARRE